MMRKTYKILLFTVLVLLLAVMTVLAASAANEPFEVATFDGSSTVMHGSYATFQEALSAVKAFDANTINLLDSVTLSTGVTIDVPLTLNGQGNTLTFARAVSGNAITFGTDGAVTLNDVTVAMLSTTSSSRVFYVKANGIYTLYNVIATGGYNTFYYDASGTIVVDGWNSAIGRGNAAHTWVANAPCQLQLFDGKIDTTDGTGDLFSINAGGFGSKFFMSGGQLLSGGDVFYAKTMYSVTVMGGSVYGTGSVVNPNASAAGSTFFFSDCTIEAGTYAMNLRGEGTKAILQNVTMSGVQVDVAAGASLTVDGGTYTFTKALNIYGSANIQSGDFTFEDSSNAYGIDIKAGADADAEYTVTLGAGVTVDSARYSIIIRANRKALVEGGEYSGCVYLDGGNLHIKDGIFTNTAGSSPQLFQCTAAATKVIIDDGSFTARVNHALAFLNYAGNSFEINGGTFTAPSNSTCTESTYHGLFILNNADAEMNINGGVFNLRADNVPIILNQNGKLAINSGTFYAYNTAQCLHANHNSDSSRTVIDGGKFTGSTSNALVSVSLSLIDADVDTDAFVVNDGLFVTTSGTGNVMEIALQSGITVTINGGQFIAKNGQRGLCLFGVAGSAVNINGGFYSYIERNYIYNADDTMKSNLAGVSNSYGYNGCLGALSVDSESSVTVTGGVFYGGPTGVAMVLYNAENFVVDGDVSLYGDCCLDMAMSNGSVNATVYDAAFRRIPGQNAYTAITTNHVDDAYYASDSYIYIYGANFDEYGGENAQIIINDSYTVKIGGEYVKNGETRQNNMSFRSVGSGAVISMTAAGSLIIYDGSFFSADTAVIATAGVVEIYDAQIIAFNRPMEFSGSASATIYDCFCTFLDTITGPEGVDPNATEQPQNSAGVKFNEGVLVNTTGVVNIYGGFFHQGSSRAAVNVEEGTLHIYDGIFYGYRALRLQGAGAINVYGGNFYGAMGQYNTILIFVTGTGTLSIQGGNFDLTPSAMNGVAGDRGIVYVEKEATVTISGGTFKAGRSPGATASQTCGLFALTAGKLYLQGGTFIMVDGLTVAKDFSRIYIQPTEADGPVTFVVGEGSTLPAADNAKFANAVWEWQRNDVIEISDKQTVTDLAAFFASYKERIYNDIASKYHYIIPGVNCTVDIGEESLFVVQGGELTLDTKNAFTTAETLVTVKAGGKLIVLGGEYIGENFGEACNGLIHLQGGELLIQGGTFTMTDGGSVIYISEAAEATIQSGTFRASRILCINTSCTDSGGLPAAGVTVSVSGGIYEDTAVASPLSGSHSMFEICGIGIHTVSIENATITASPYSTVFNMTSCVGGVTLYLNDTVVEGGMIWIDTRDNATVSVQDTTFLSEHTELDADILGKICVNGAASNLSFEKATFTVTSDVALFGIGSDAVQTCSVTLNGVQATVNRFMTELDAPLTFHIVDIFLILTGEDSVIFDCTNTLVTKAVVVANACTVMNGVELDIYATEVYYRGDLLRAWVKGIATNENIFSVQMGGAAIEVDCVVDENDSVFSGLRFCSTLSPEVIALLQSTYPGASFAFGTVIAPADYVVAAGEFTMEALDKIEVSGVAYVDIPAVETVVDRNGDGIPEAFSAALIDLNDYKRVYAAVSYINVSYHGETYFLYSAYDSLLNARSACQVANAIIADTDSSYYTVYSPAQKAIVDMYCHGWSAWTVTTTATCLTEGAEMRTCVCGEVQTRVIPIDSANHVGGVWTTTVLPNCQMEGEETCHCPCGEILIRSLAKDTSNHVFGDFTLITAPTCQATGEEIGICPCGETQTRIVAKDVNNHVFGNYVITKESTCQTQGEQTRTCPCGKAETLLIAINPDCHKDWGEWVVVTAPTLNTVGLQKRTCLCGAVETAEIPVIQGTSVTLKNYRIVYASDASETLINSLNALAALIKQSTGVTVSVKPVGAQSAVTYEILVGNTGRAESTAALNNLNGRGYYMGVINNKIVFNGTTNYLAMMALEVFLNEYISAGLPSVVIVEDRAVNVEMLQITSAYQMVVSHNSYGIAAFGSSLDANNTNKYDLARYLATDLIAKYSAYFGSMNVMQDTNAASSREILIGRTMMRTETREFLAKLDANGYGIAIHNGKVVVGAYTDTTLVLVMKLFGDMIADSIYLDANGKAVVMLPASYEKTLEGDLGWVLDFPRPSGTGISLSGAADVYDSSLQFLYTGEGVTAEAYLSYCQKLVDAGYTLHSGSEVEGSIFRTYINSRKNITLYVAYNAFKYADEQNVTIFEPAIRIISAPLSAVNLPDNDMLNGKPYVKLTETMITNIELEGGTYNNSGNVYIITLEDGTFVVVDGGSGDTTAIAQRIYNALCDLYYKVHGKRASATNKITIAAWYLTHGHGDHYSGFVKFIDNATYRQYVDMQRVITNFPSDYEVFNSCDINLNVRNNVMANLLSYYPAIKYYKVHTGQTFWLANSRFEVLFTHEDQYPYGAQYFNDAGVVIRQTINVNGAAIGSVVTPSMTENAITMLWLGDVQNRPSSWMRAMWGDYLKSDMVQVAHHGAMGCEFPFYQLVAAKVLWWPTYRADFDKILSSTNPTHYYNTVNAKLVAMDCVEWIILGSAENVTVTITANGPDMTVGQSATSLYGAGTNTSNLGNNYLTTLPTTHVIDKRK